MIKALIIIGIILVALFIITFVIYFLKLDMKLVRFVYEKLQPHYDNLEQDRKL